MKKHGVLFQLQYDQRTQRRISLTKLKQLLIQVKPTINDFIMDTT